MVGSERARTGVSSGVRRAGGSRT
eukprot:ctg_5269.g475